MPPKKKLPPKSFDQVLQSLRLHQFGVQEMPGTPNQMQIRKYGCGAVLGRSSDGGVAYFSRPGCLIAGEISSLVDRGYQKFLTTSRFQLPATADHLRALHQFTEEVREIAGSPVLYNEALGTVSDLYLYDRLQGRDHEPKAEVEAH